MEKIIHVVLPRLVIVIVAAAFLPTLELVAQQTPSDLPGTNEVLSASSPYGEAMVKRNIPYVTNPTPRQNFDLYLPKSKGDQPFPLIVWIHGGAWMMGSKEWDNVKYLVQQGYAIATIDYRLSTEVPFPAQIQDCNSALNFILAHATDYGIDPRRFVIGGAPAGGHLALLLGLARNEQDFGADSRIKPLAILDFFGPTDLNKISDESRTADPQKNQETIQDSLTKFLAGPIEQAAGKAKIASPVTYVNADSPPVLILHGGKDNLVPIAQSQQLHDLLDKAGVKNQFIIVDMAGHDGPLFATPEVKPKVINFINAAFEKSGDQAQKNRD